LLLVHNFTGLYHKDRLSTVLSTVTILYLIKMFIYTRSEFDLTPESSSFI